MGKLVQGARPHVSARVHVALTVLATTQLMLVLDGAVVNIALPSIQSDLGLSDGTLAWVVNGYVLAGGGLLLLGGRAGDLFGRRRVFLIGIGVFTLASLLGGFATNGALLIACRIAQGVGAAIAGPTALALISTTFPTGPLRTRALAVSSAAAGAGTAVGLIAGGLLTDFFSWRSVMLVNVPFGVLVLAVAPRVLPHASRQAGPVDFAGAMLASVGLGGLVFGISRAGDPGHGWTDPIALSCLASAAAALVAFVWRQTLVPNPLLPLGLFRNRDRTCAYIVVLLVGASLSLTYFLSLQVQHVMGYSPVRAGLAFLPFAFGIAGGSWVAARLARRCPPRAVTGSGLLLAVIGVLNYRGFSVDSSYAGDLLGPMLIWSTGMGMTFVPMTATVLTAVPERQTGIASAVMGAGQQVGGALGLAALVTISTRVQEGRAAEGGNGSGGPAAAVNALTAGYAAAYTASLVLLLLAGIVTVFGVTASTRDVESSAAMPATD